MYYIAHRRLETKERSHVWGNVSFWPRAVSTLSRFGQGLFRPGSFWPESFWPWVVSANFGELFQPDFFKYYTMLYFR